MSHFPGLREDAKILAQPGGDADRQAVGRTPLTLVGDPDGHRRQDNHPLTADAEGTELLSSSACGGRPDERNT